MNRREPDGFPSSAGNFNNRRNFNVRMAMAGRGKISARHAAIRCLKKPDSQGVLRDDAFPEKKPDAAHE